MIINTWFVATVRPGGSAVAKPRLQRHVVRRDDRSFLFHCDPRQPDRHGECEVEREIRDSGLDCYRPMMRKESQHRRTHRMIVRTFPLFTGYIFVAAPDAGSLARLTTCDHVGPMLGIDGIPKAVPTGTVEALMKAQSDLAFDDTREAMKKRGLDVKRGKSGVGQSFPIGARVRVKDDAVHRSPFYGFHGHVRSVTGRGMVQAMIDLFGRMVPVEFPASDLEVVDAKGEAA